MLRFPSFAVLLAAALALPSVALADAPRLAVVDVEATMNATDHWKKAKADLEKDKAGKQTSLELRQRELRAKKEKLDAQRAVSAPGQIEPQEEALAKDVQNLTENFMKSQQDLTAREKKLTDAMLSRIEGIVRDIAAAGEYDFVFETGTKESPNVLYMKANIDITQKVIAEYQKRFKDKPLEAAGK